MKYSLLPSKLCICSMKGNELNTFPIFFTHNSQLDVFVLIIAAIFTFKYFDITEKKYLLNPICSCYRRHRHNNKEYLKKKKQKKQQRFKELEEERETDKNKWLNFTSKSTKKAGTSKIKSIFASPENVNGRVGIGTCGVSGNPMTKYSYGEKYRKGT